MPILPKSASVMSYVIALFLISIPTYLVTAVLTNERGYQLAYGVHSWVLRCFQQFLPFIKGVIPFTIDWTWS